MLRCQFLCHVLIALFFIKIALKLSYICKKMQTFQALGALPPDPRASGGWGSAPRLQPPVSGGFVSRQPLASGGWGLRPQTPKTVLPHYEFLATHLGVHLSAGLHLNSGKKVLQFW